MRRKCPRWCERCTSHYPPPYPHPHLNHLYLPLHLRRRIIPKPAAQVSSAHTGSMDSRRLSQVRTRVLFYSHFCRSFLFFNVVTWRREGIYILYHYTLNNMPEGYIKKQTCYCYYYTSITNVIVFITLHWHNGNIYTWYLCCYYSDGNIFYGNIQEIPYGLFFTNEVDVLLSRTQSICAPGL